VSVISGQTSGNGSGVNGELTAGYEIARATTARLFVQADATLPFYRITYTTMAYSPPSRSGPSTPRVAASTRRYAPSVVVSMGVGWQRGRR
jgi:hypothetical protein